MMKLGKDTGSLVNHVVSRATAITPEIGGGATLLQWSDRKPATVIDLFTKGKFDYIVVQEDNAKRTDDRGMSEMQDYEYTPNPNGAKRTFRITESGYHHVHKSDSGRYVKSSDLGLSVGQRESYHDFSF